MRETLIIAKDLGVRRPDGFSLSGLSFTLTPGQHLIITGPSGAGKTTLAEALAGKLFVTGELSVTPQPASSDAKEMSVQLVRQRYQIKNRSNTVDGYYQQRYNSTENEDAYTVMEELQAVLNDPDKINRLLDELSIDYLAGKTLLKLSSGEHKRFQLVKMLLKPAPLVILDEPFVGLDVSSRAKLNDILVTVAAQGTQFIIIAGATAHFPKVATHVLELQSGIGTHFGPISGYNPGFEPTVHRYSLDALQLDKVALNYEIAVRLVNTTVRYGDRTILSQINWTVGRGEKWLLKGPNGAGKSTLLSLIYGDNPQAYANEIYLFDRRRGSGESIWDIKKNMGFVSPELHAFFDKNLSCFQVVASGYFDTMGLYRVLSSEQTAQLQAWLKILGLENIANKRLSTISTGMQRLIMLVRAFIKRPAMLILDEPCQGLDQWQTASFVKLVEDYGARTGAALIYISHYTDEIPEGIDHVMELRPGNYRIYGSKNKTENQQLKNKEQSHNLITN